MSRAPWSPCDQRVPEVVAVASRVRVTVTVACVVGWERNCSLLSNAVRRICGCPQPLQGSIWPMMRRPAPHHGTNPLRSAPTERPPRALSQSASGKVPLLSCGGERLPSRGKRRRPRWASSAQRGWGSQAHQPRHMGLHCGVQKRAYAASGWGQCGGARP